MVSKAVWIATARLGRFSFDELKTYTQTIELALEKEKKTIQKAITSKTKSIDQVGELYAEDYMKMSKTFPNIARMATFLTAFSTLENLLLELCWNLQKSEKQVFGPEDLSRGFRGTRTYLEKVTGIDISALDDRYEISKFAKIRNVLVHQAGNIRQEETKFRNLIKSMPGVKIADSGVVHLSKEFCDGAIDKMRQFFDDLVNELKEKV